jgi:pro-kumamolisin-like protein/putative Ig domain-containing protein
VVLSPHGRPLHRLAVALAATALLAFGLLAFGLAAASAAPLRGGQVGATFRVGHAPTIPAGTRARGVLPQSSVITTMVALSVRDPAALAAYAHGVSTPGSSSYRHYLSVAQFAQRFAPSASGVAAVRAVLQARGLQPGALAANGLSFNVTASAGTLSHAFATSFERYQVPDGRSAFANTSAPALPQSVSGLVQGVIGLDSLAAPTPSGLVESRPAKPHPSAARSPAPAPGGRAAIAPGEGAACLLASASGGHTAGQIAAAYGLSDLYAAGNGGSGTTIALFELEPYAAADVAAYQACYGTSVSVTNVAVSGGAGSGSGAGEAALDIEDLIGLAPGASIIVYEGKNTGTGALQTYQAIVTQDRAKVVSTSWGLCEPQEGISPALAAGVENNFFQEAAVQGQTILAASGDHGAQDCPSGTGSSRASVDDPASQPYVTGVGGTSLTSLGPPTAESVWNSTWEAGANPQSGASGGGVSRIWGQPSYQAGIAVPQTATTCPNSSTRCREVPDVAADADINTGYSIYFKGHWSVFGGTSAAAPTWAALVALADASPACAGRTVGFANPALYAAASSAYSTYFNDVVTGNNSYHGIGGFSAGPGYDLATGLGSPKGAPIAAVMCGSVWSPPATPAPVAPTPAPNPVVTLTHPAAQRARVGQPVRVPIKATDSAGETLTYRSTRLPAGLSLSAATGLISGIPKRAGRSIVTITVSDTAGASAQATGVWSIAGRPTITGGLKVNARGRPSLSLKVGAGTNAPPIQSIVVIPSSRVRFARRARNLARGITVRNGSGRRVKSSARLRGADLVVTLRASPVRVASLHITVPAISLVTVKARQEKGRRPALLEGLTVTVTDASAYRTAFLLR